MRYALYTVLLCAMMMAGCAETYSSGSDFTRPPSPNPRQTLYKWVSAPGRYLAHPATQAYQLMTDEQGQPLMSCPPGYIELPIPGTGAMNAMECRNNHQTPPIPSGLYADPNADKACRPPWVVDLVGGSYECRQSCQRGLVVVPHDGYLQCEAPGLR